jgi:hypothetical protein
MPWETNKLRAWYKARIEKSDAKGFYTIVDEARLALRAGRVAYRRQITKSDHYGSTLKSLGQILAHTLAPFRLHDEGFLYPVVDDLTSETIERAITASAELGGGVKTHFREAIRFLNEGDFAKSAKESWDTLESCVKRLGGDKQIFSDGLKHLKAANIVPRNLADSWDKIHGYTNETPGIRHSLKAGERADVGEAEAIYLLSACGAAVSYLRARIE